MNDFEEWLAAVYLAEIVLVVFLEDCCPLANFLIFL